MANSQGAVASTGGATALAAAGTARTLLNVIAASGKALSVSEWGIEFDGVTSGLAPILVELCRSTQAGAGSGSSSVTPNLARGKESYTIGSSAQKNYATTEPTVLTVVREVLVDPNKGIFVEQLPLGREIESAVAGGIAIRVTPASGLTPVPNARAWIEFEE